MSPILKKQRIFKARVEMKNSLETNLRTFQHSINKHSNIQNFETCFIRIYTANK